MRLTKLQRHIGTGFAIIWMIMTIVIVLALVRMDRISRDLDAIANQNNIKIGLAVEMRDIIYQRQLLMRNSLIYGDTFERDANRAKLEILAQQFINLRDSLLSLDTSPAEAEIHEAMKLEIAKANTKGMRLVELMLFEGLNDETRNLMREVTAGQNQVIHRLNELVTYETGQINQAVASTQESQSLTRNMVMLLGAIAAALNFLIARAVIRNSVRQTEKIEQLAKFASENPRPVLRISVDGELIYANSASRVFLDSWETRVGHLVPLEWRKLVSKAATEQQLVEQEAAIGDQVFSVVLTPVENSNYVNVYGHDITEREQIRQEFARMASHDSLTGLINRRELEHVLEGLITDASINLTEHAFLYFDLDQFKVVNDTCGHVAGDELLRQLSALFKKNVRGSDKLGRLGGDEFGLLLHSCSLVQAEKIAENLRQLIENFRFVWKEQSFNIGASIGVVSVTADSGNLSSVLSAADAACYIAKESGRNRVHVSYPGDEQLLQRRGQMEWVQRIRDAIEMDQFELYFQGIHSLDASSKTGPRGEVLIRLFDKNGELVPTETFIQAAERYDLMTSIDRWVLGQAIPMLVERLKNTDSPNSWYSINLSGQSISDRNFAEYVIGQLEQNKVPASAICFEITETAAISNLSMAIEFISAMREKGCLIALDDFGSGLSSFNYLQNLKIDYLKIDGSFVRNMHEDNVSAAMVEAIAKVAHEMGIGVIAEWVEKKETIQLLRKLKVELAQGYAFDKPVPMDSGEFRRAVI